MIKFFAISTILFITSFSFTQVEIIGTIFEVENKNPVEYANVKLYKKADSILIGGAFTNEKGNFNLEVNAKGEHFAIITAFGFEDQTISSINLDLIKKKYDLGKIFIKSETSQEFDEVVVRAEKEVIKTGFDKKVYNTSEDMTSQGGDATDILNNIPSVEVDNDGNISLRGSGNVMILIDGRPSAMTSGAEGALDGIPASSIERIELVTNPSAKYDPDGTAGIINIVLKKNKLRGTNTSVDLSAASGNLYNSSINFNYRNDKVNLYTNYSFRYREGYRDNMNDRISSIDNNEVNLFQDRSGTDTRRSHTGKVGVDYTINEQSLVGLSVSGTYNDRIRTGDQYNHIAFNDNIDRYWNRQTADPRNRQSIDINGDYKYDFKDKSGDFLAVLTQSFGSSESEGDYNERYFNADGTPTMYDSKRQYQNGVNTENTFTGSADVQKNVTDDFRYETGVKTILRSLYRSNYLENMDTITGVMVPDSNVINEFEFDENIFSVYGIAAHQINKFKYQVGVRLEQAYTTPRLLTTNEDFENNYFSFFPSAHVIYGKEDKRGEISLSYSRRINRPNSWNLNPFPVYSDPLNLRQGNPALQPEYINSYDFGYQKKFKELTLSGSVYYRQTIDKIQRIRQFFPDGVSINTFANIDESYDYGVELISIYSPFKWWKNVLSVNGNETRLAANVNGVDLRNSGFTYNVKLNSTFTLFKGTTTAQINAQYISPTFTVQGYYQRFTGIDLGINRLFLDKKLSLGVRLTDIFDQQGFYLEVNDGPYTQESMYKWQTRRIYLNVSYKFGKMEAGNNDRKKTPSGGGGEGGDF